MSDENKMEDWQQRVVQEKADLDEKIGKLETFTMTEAFKALPDADAILLNVQLEKMEGYSRTLGARIARFGYLEAAACQTQ